MAGRAYAETLFAASSIRRIAILAMPLSLALLSMIAL